MGMPGRQAYFREFIVHAMTNFWGDDVEIDVQDLYVASNAEAHKVWIDDAPCQHGSSQLEWQHDLRWSLLQLRAEGRVERVRRGVYRLR